MTKNPATHVTQYLMQTHPNEWEKRNVSRSSVGRDYLSESYIIAAASFVGLSQSNTKQALKCAEKIRQNDDLLAAANIIHDLTFAPESGSLEVSNLPIPTELSVDLSGFFYVVLLLAGLPRLKAIHSRLHVNLSITRESAHELDRRASRGAFSREHGVPGIDGYNFSWLMMIWNGELFQIGRFLFSLWIHPGIVRVFESPSSGTITAISEGELVYLRSGLNVGSGGITDKEGSWTAFVRETETEVIGNPISLDGFAHNREIVLKKSKWVERISKGTQILDFHIPDGSSLDSETCAQSFSKAIRFFKRHFPDQSFAAFECGSWLMDPVFSDILPTDSNLAQFQREFYLFPCFTGYGDRMPAEVRRGKDGRQTTMEIRFIEYLNSGGRFNSGGGFLPVDDFRWGKTSSRYALI